MGCSICFVHLLFVCLFVWFVCLFGLLVCLLLSLSGFQHHVLPPILKIPCFSCNRIFKNWWARKMVGSLTDEQRHAYRLKLLAHGFFDKKRAVSAFKFFNAMCVFFLVVIANEMWVFGGYCSKTT